ncbi:tRNA (guanosine(37)-N1)-methyltransferase TrmD [Patescibacteria group bacterium]|nr:tRNA (guanosine(37)-N1)-methyltransferase TrmD [Patescibacteria group bacterium]
MRYDIITLFPDMLQGPLEASILKRAQAAGQVEVHIHNMRDSATDHHKTVDDTPYGGGAGMVLKVDIMDACLKAVLAEPEVAAIAPERRRIILLTPQGKRFRQGVARHIAERYDQITLICGHYEGFDERIRSLVDAELSIGDFVLTGGELPALVVVDAVTRLLPSVIREESPEEESFSLTAETGETLLEYPQYTRPPVFNGQAVPEVLLSGHHAEIKKWRLEQARMKTRRVAEQGDDETI